MKRFHVALVSLLLAAAAVVGAVAMTRTAHVGAAARQAGDAAYRARVRRLNAAEAKLRRALAARPAAPGKAQTPRIVFRRPAPIVVTTHRGHEYDDAGEGRDD